MITEDHVVVDVEIQKTIEELPGKWNDTDKMGVAVAVVYEFRTDRFRIYGPEDIDALRSRLLVADRISGYNIWRFDFPVIWGLPSRERVEPLRQKTNDLLLRIWRSCGLSTENFTKDHGGWKLDQVASATLDVGKIGNGADAPRWYQAGLIHKVINYCVDDVAIERDLAVFIDKWGYVVSKDGEALKITEDWQP